jgi:hypothetical protein
MIMKRLLIFALMIGVSVAIATPSLAIEKRKKETPPPKSDTTAVVRPKPQPQSRPPADSVDDTLKVPKQRRILPLFNDFIDVNRNGIDDRLEQGGYVIPPKQRPKSPPAIKMTEKSDSLRTVTPKPSPKKTEKKGK